MLCDPHVFSRERLGRHKMSLVPVLPILPRQEPGFCSLLNRWLQLEATQAERRKDLADGSCRVFRPVLFVSRQTFPSNGTGGCSRRPQLNRGGGAPWHYARGLYHESPGATRAWILWG